MAKKNIFAPGILFTIPDPQPTTVIGGGTGQSTTDPYACSYADWQTMFAGDYDGDDVVGTMNDYMIWWANNNFGMDAWNEFNPGVPFEPDYGGV